VLKRFLAVLATATLGLGLALGAAMPASAHVPDYKATCASLDVNLYAYSGGTNYVTVTVDNAVVQAKTAFSGSFVKSFTWTTSAAHTFKIEIDATENEWDRLGTNAIAGTSGPCSTVTACLNPLSNTLKNFTMVTTGDVTLNSSSHVTGTIAAGGNVIVSQAGYSVGNNEDGSSLPVVDGKSTGLLVGGKVTLNASDAALKVLAGATRVGDTTGAAITESNRYHPISANSPYVQMSANATLAEVGAAGLWNTTFSGTFTTLAANANTIAAYGASDAQFVTLLDNGGDGKKVKLVEGVTNVLRISASDLSAVTKLFFDGTGASPSATTPFIIDVTTSASSGAVTMKAPVINNVNPRFVLWNFAKITGSATLNLSTGTGNDFVRGSILIPGAAVNLTAGGIEGQVAAKAMTHASGSEIHHFAYSACGTTPPKTVTVSTAPSATPPTCTVDGSLVIPTQANVAFSGGTNGAGPGSYTITAVGTNGYTLTGTASWPIVVKAKGDGVNCEKSTEPTLTVATCDATTGNVVSAFITIPNLQNLSYTIAGVNGGNRLTPGSNVSLGQGNYTVNVAGINGYTNTGPTSYPVNIAAFDCNKAVKPALTVATCDVTTGLLTSAYITIPTTTPGLEYTIAGVNGGQPLSGNVNLGVGTYTVTVAAKSGFTNTGPSSFQIVVAQLTCEKAVQPTLTVAVCQPTTGAFQSAYITIPTTTPGLEYSITGVNGGNALTPGSNVNVPAGTTTVLVTAKTNVRNTGPTSFAIVVPALSCEKAVQPAIIIAACDATTGALTPASVKITNTAPGLEYRIAGINGGNILPGGSTWNLPAGTHTVTVTEKAGVTNTGPASFEIVVASLSCEQAVEPTLTVAECDADGDVVSASLTATTTTPGLTYTIHGSGAVLQPGIKTAVTQGTYIIDVTTAAGVKNTGPTTFTIKVDSLDCNESVEPVLTVAQCDATTGPKSAYLTIPTTTPGLIYSIGGKDYAAGDKVDVPAGPYTVAVRAAAGFTNTGKSSFTGTVPAIDCDSENYVEPTVTPQTCDTDLGGVKNGSLLFALNPDLAYKLDGTLVTTALVSNVAAGPHTITVIPAAGHYIAGGIDTFTVTVPAAVDCDGVYTTPLDPFADPEVCDPFSDTADVLNGSITVVHVAGIQWYIGTEADGADKVAVGTPATVGSVRYAYPAGDYFVFAESKDASITIKPGHTTWPLTVKVPNPTCIPTLGLFEANATATGAVCDAFGDSKGTITILPTPGVSYAIKGGPALTSTTTKVAPGTYTVLATLNVPGGTLSADSWVLTVASTSVLCDLETLAFTGQNLTGYLVMAALLFQAGLALVAVQFIRARRKARHLAA
jgi:choice-of-anchor A domain-containing protein